MGLGELWPSSDTMLEFMDQALHGYAAEEEGLIYTNPIGLC